MSDTKHVPALVELAGLRREIGRLEGQSLELIDKAREEGASWADIGEAMGMTRQAAWKRWGESEH